MWKCAELLWTELDESEPGLCSQNKHSTPTVDNFISSKNFCARTFVPLSLSLWNDLSGPVFDGVGLAGFKSRANAFLLAWSALSFLSPIILWVRCVGLGSSGW